MTIAVDMGRKATKTNKQNIFDLMHDVETAMLHYQYLEISTEYVWCSENFNMQFSRRLIIQTYIDIY